MSAEANYRRAYQLFTEAGRLSRDLTSRARNRARIHGTDDPRAERLIRAHWSALRRLQRREIALAEAERAWAREVHRNAAEMTDLQGLDIHTL